MAGHGVSGGEANTPLRVDGSAREGRRRGCGREAGGLHPKSRRLSRFDLPRLVARPIGITKMMHQAHHHAGAPSTSNDPQQTASSSIICSCPRSGRRHTSPSSGNSAPRFPPRAPPTDRPRSPSLSTAPKAPREAVRQSRKLWRAVFTLCQSWGDRQGGKFGWSLSSQRSKGNLMLPEGIRCVGPASRRPDETHSRTFDSSSFHSIDFS